MSTITAIYLRVSTTEQTLGLEAQERACLKYADLRELVDVRIYQDVGVSGSVPMGDRAEGSRLIDDIEAGHVATVVAVRLDRLFRDTADTLKTLSWWSDCGVSLHLLDMGGAAVDTSSPIGRFMITMLAGMAEFERSLIAERTIAAKAAARARGQFMGGAVPWGFRVERGHLYPHPSERMTFDLFEKCRSRGLTLAQCAENLNGRGLKNRGRDWRPDTLTRRLGKFRKTKLQEASG